MTSFVTRLTGIFTRGSRVWVLAGLALLIAGSPLGGGASHPAAFTAYRVVLALVAALCIGSLAGKTARDLPLWVYLAGTAGLTLSLVSVWASPGSNPSGESLWYEHLWFSVFFVALVRFSSLQSARWRRTALGLVAGSTLTHLALTRFWVESFENPNHLAAYLIVGLAGPFAAALFARDWKWRMAGAAASLALFAGITATLSRGATLAALAMAGAGLLKLGRRETALAGAAGLAAVTIAVAILNPGLVGQFTDRGEIDPYNYQRVEIWRSTASMIAENPLLGVGLTRYDDVARRFRPPAENTIGRYMKRQATAHSEYLQYAAEGGMGVGLLVLLLTGGYILLLWRSEADDPAARVPERAALLGGLGVAVHGMVDNVFEVPVVLAALTTVALASGPLTRITRWPAVQSAPARWAAGTAALFLFAASTALPAAAYGLNRVGQARLESGDLDAAERAQRLALAVASDDPVLMTNLGRVYKARFEATGAIEALDLAEAYYRRAIEANPELLAPRDEYADTLLARFTGLPGADIAIHRRLAGANEDILALDPFLPTVGMNLAEAYYRSGRFEDAYVQLRRTIELEPNFVPGYLKLAEWYRQDGREPESRAMRDEAVSIVNRYSDRVSLTDYESLLLGRP